MLGREIKIGRFDVCSVRDIGASAPDFSLSPLLFNLAEAEATKDCRRGVPWDIFYDAELVLTAESKVEVQDQFNRWNSAIESISLKYNF